MEQWLSPTQLSQHIPLKPWSIRALIKEGTLKHGYHYIDKRVTGKQRPTYVLNLLRMKEFLSLSPEKRERT